MEIEEIIEPKKKKTNLFFDLMLKLEGVDLKMTPLRGFVSLFLLSFFLIMLLELTQGESSGRGHAPARPNHKEVKFKDIPSRLGRYLLFSLMIGAMGAYVGSIIKKKNDENIDTVFVHGINEKKVICENCVKIKKDDGLYNCECGGLFVPADKLNWTEKDKPQE